MKEELPPPSETFGWRLFGGSLVGSLGCLTAGWWLFGGGSTELLDPTSVPFRGHDESLKKLLISCISFSHNDDLFLFMDMFEVDFLVIYIETHTRI